MVEDQTHLGVTPWMSVTWKHERKAGIETPPLQISRGCSHGELGKEVEVANHMEAPGEPNTTVCHRRVTVCLASLT